MSINDLSVNVECKKGECLTDCNCNCLLSKPQSSNQASSLGEIKKIKGLNVIYTNTDVLHNKLKELELIALKEKADIIAVTEILLKNMPSYSKPEDFVFKIEGFTTIHNYNGRGLCVFIRDGLNYSQLFDYTSLKTGIFINFPSSNGNLTLGVIYRSPNSSHNDDNELLNVINYQNLSN